MAPYTGSSQFSLFRRFCWVSAHKRSTSDSLCNCLLIASGNQSSIHVYQCCQGSKPPQSKPACTYRWHLKQQILWSSHWWKISWDCLSCGEVIVDASFKWTCQPEKFIQNTTKVKGHVNKWAIVEVDFDLHVSSSSAVRGGRRGGKKWIMKCLAEKFQDIS